MSPVGAMIDLMVIEQIFKNNITSWICSTLHEKKR